jgi:TPP-dependent pyruvate/acetoin dehydrogenase alpha subunit
MYDPELYRSKEEVEQWKTQCPITALEARLRSEDQFLDKRRAEMETAIATEIEKAVAFAEDGPWEPVEDLLKDVLTLEQ